MRVPPVFISALIAIGMAAAAVQAPSEQTSPALPTRAELEEGLQPLVSQGGYSAVGIALVSAGHEPVFLSLAGEGGDSGDSDSRFGFGSITQSLLAMGMIRMKHADRPLTDARVVAILPGLPMQNSWEESHPLRIEHLLEHTSGFWELPLSELAGERQAPGSIRDLLERSSESLVCRYRPGRFNLPVMTDALVAALAVEETAGEPLELWLEETVLQPLELSAAFPRTEGDGAASGEARFRPVLGLEGSVKDLAAVVRLLLQRGRLGEFDFLSELEVQRMETPATSDAFRNGLQVGYGLGIRTFLDRGFVFYGAESLRPGELATFRYLPQHGLGFVILAKGGREADFHPLIDALDVFCTMGLQPPQPLFVDLPEGRIAAVDGYYRPLTSRWDWTIFFQRVFDVAYIEHLQGRLQVESPAGAMTQLFPVTDRRFRAEGEPLPTIVFSRGEDSRTVVEGFSEHFQGNYVRASGGQIWLERVVGFLGIVLLASWTVFALLSLAVRLVRGGRGRVNLLFFLLPVLAAVAVAAVVVPVSLAGEDLVSEFGRVTWASVALFLGSLLSPVLSLAAAVMLSLTPGRSAGRNVRLFAVAATIGAVLLSAYFVWWGVFGLRTWV